MGTKKSLTIYIVKDENGYFRGATLFREKNRALIRIPTNPLPLTQAHVAEYSAEAFPCALGGPFNDLRFIWFSATPALCTMHHHFYLHFNGLVY